MGPYTGSLIIASSFKRQGEPTSVLALEAMGVGSSFGVNLDAGNARFGSKGEIKYQPLSLPLSP